MSHASCSASLSCWICVSIAGWAGAALDGPALFDFRGLKTSRDRFMIHTLLVTGVNCNGANGRKAGVELCVSRPAGVRSIASSKRGNSCSDGRIPAGGSHGFAHQIQGEGSEAEGQTMNRMQLFNLV